MNFSTTRASLSTGFFLIGLSLAGFLVLISPTDPADFLVEAVLRPQETFSIVYAYMQSMAFWFSAVCMAIGIACVAVLALHRLRKRQLFSRLNEPRSDSGDGEENWMFL